MNKRYLKARIYFESNDRTKINEFNKKIRELAIKYNTNYHITTSPIKIKHKRI